MIIVIYFSYLNTLFCLSKNLILLCSHQCLLERGPEFLEFLSVFGFIDEPSSVLLKLAFMFSVFFSS